MKCWLVALVVLVGCTLPPVALPPAQRGALEATADAWDEAGLPHSSRIELADVRYVARPCNDPGSVTTSCLSQAGNRPIIQVRDTQDRADMTPIVHEGIHLAEDDVLGDADPWHRDPRCWSAAGGDEAARDASVQRRAWRKLGVPAPGH